MATALLWPLTIYVLWCGRMAELSRASRCINIDWLEVYCLESFRNYPHDADYFAMQGYEVDVRAYGTRIYREMFIVSDATGHPLVEVRRNPVHGDNDRAFIEPYSCHLRLPNVACYYAEPVQLLINFMSRHGFTFKKLFRIDICCDFTQFDKGDDPQKVVHRYIKGQYSKVNQSNLAAHGRDQWDGRYWNSLSWGQPKSMVSTKLYNKTMELRQAKDKPYIRYAWHAAGLVDDPVTLVKHKPDGSEYYPDVWRVEFSIKASAAKWLRLDADTKRKRPELVLPHSLDVFAMRDTWLTIFASLARQYFHFKKFKAGQRKDRCPDKVLFDFSSADTIYKVDRSASHRPLTKEWQRLIDKLRAYKWKNADDNIRKALDVIITAIEGEQIVSDAFDTEYLLYLRAVRYAIAQRVAHPELPVYTPADLLQLVEQLRETF